MIIPMEEAPEGEGEGESEGEGEDEDGGINANVCERVIVKANMKASAKVGGGEG